MMPCTLTKVRIKRHFFKHASALGYTLTQLSDAYINRFGGIARLYGVDALEALNEAHFAVVGLGGVGSWAAEALARTGIGTITLIELDDVCVSNTNRQSHALDSRVGESKLDVVGERLMDINPELNLYKIHDFLTLKNIRDHIDARHHVVIDAIDSSSVKAGLIAYCSAIKVRLVVVGSSGGKQDPSKVQASDLAKTKSDPMLAKIRGQLFRHYNFSRDPNRKFRIDAVFSTEQMVYPQPDGSVCMDKQAIQEGVKLDCTNGFGSSVMVTGAFGFTAAAKGIERYLLKFGPNAPSKKAKPPG